MTIKTIYFPSMKYIIFEAIHSILLSKKFPLMFEFTVVKFLVESINLYGMSIDKFRRFIKMLLTEFLYRQEFYYVHDVDF